ncbi:hypothetical protein Adt_35101 [Abeliophyllum distichum]|uniref:Uncharacterized protein n=1 Tax=Abeliophyllum distichum TaxID=126358 RepID=A0ABD1QDS7_9LAMI
MQRQAHPTHEKFKCSVVHPLLEKHAHLLGPESTSSISAGILYASLSFIKSSSTIIEGISKAAHLTTSTLNGSSASLKLGAASMGSASPVFPSTPQIGSTPSIDGDTEGDASPPTHPRASLPVALDDISTKRIL